MEQFSVISLASQIPTEADAYRYLEELRWGDRPVCPHCGSIDRHYFLNPTNGISRETSSGASSQRRIWKCGDCRKKFSATTGTVMHGSHVSLRVWLFVLFEMASNKNGIAAREVERKYGVNPRTAWHLTQRIREAMASGSGLPQLAGTVVADEAYIGGDPRFKHQQGRTVKLRRGRKPGGPVYKTGVFSIVHQQTGEVRSWVVTEVNTAAIVPLLRANVDIPRSILYTDSSPVYTLIGRLFSSHEAVDHVGREYVKPSGASTNKVENYFSQLKRSLDGTHHHVSAKHLSRYLAEFDYRFSTCDVSDQDRMAAIVRKTAGRRLSYESLKGGSTLAA